jgi:hypothetical protein
VPDVMVFHSRDVLARFDSAETGEQLSRPKDPDPLTMALAMSCKSYIGGVHTCC